MVPSTETNELLDVFLAAMRAVVPAVTSEQTELVEQVVGGLLRERAAATPEGAREGATLP